MGPTLSRYAYEPAPAWPDMVRAVALALLSVALLAPPGQSYQCLGQGHVVCDLVPPTGFVAQAMADGVHLSWQEPPVAERPVERYSIHRTLVGTAEEAMFDAGTGLSYVDVPPQPGLYVYYVTAVYGDVRSSASNPFLAQWPYCQPVALLVDDDPVAFYSQCLTPLPI